MVVFSENNALLTVTFPEIRHSTDNTHSWDNADSLDNLFRSSSKTAVAGV